MNRKAITAETAVLSFIIFGIVLILLAVLTNMLFGVGKSQFTEAQCRASLLLTQAVDKPQKCEISVSNPVPIQCNRDFVTVTKTAVTRDGKDVTGSYNALCPADSSAPAGTSSGGTATCLSTNVIAEEMRTCWRQFFEGEKPVLQQLETDDWNFLGRIKNKITGTNRACFVCAEVTLKGDGSVADLNKYLKGTTMPGANTQPTYYKYLTNPKALCVPAMMKPDPNDPATTTCYEGVAIDRKPAIDHKALPAGTLPSGTTYAVVFVRQGLTSCSATDQVSDDPTITQTVQVIPAKSIGTQCDLVTV